MISHAVTKGLDPNAKMKDSGVEWLGMVPEGWEVVPFRRLLEKSLINGIFKKKEEPGNPGEESEEEAEENVNQGDEIQGEAVKVFLVHPEPGDKTRASFLEFCTRTLAQHLLPREVVFLEQLPRNSSGKVSKAALKAQK